MTRGKHTHTHTKKSECQVVHYMLCCNTGICAPADLVLPALKRPDSSWTDTVSLCEISVRERFSSQPQQTSQLVTPSASCTSAWEKLRYHLTSRPPTERSLRRGVKAETTGWLSIRGLRETLKSTSQSCGQTRWIWGVVRWWHQDTHTHTHTHTHTQCRCVSVTFKKCCKKSNLN